MDSNKTKCPTCGSEDTDYLDCFECFGSGADLNDETCDSCGGDGYIGGTMECSDCGNEFDAP